MLATVILVRIAWVMFYGAVSARWTRAAVASTRATHGGADRQGGIVISWCGMRGIVTLAAAFALPEGFPYRDLILLTAFAVVLGTLVIQGLTLRPLILALELRTTIRLATRPRAPAPSPIARRSRRSTAIHRRRPRSCGWNTGRCCCAPKATRRRHRLGELPADPLRRRAIAAARQRCLALRQSEEIGDDAFHLLEEELDRAELGATSGR